MPLTTMWFAQDGIVLPDFILKICIDADMLEISIECPQGGELHGQGVQPTRSKWIGSISSSSSASPPDLLECWWGTPQARRDQHLHIWAGSSNFSQIICEKPEATKAACARWQHPLPVQGLVRSSQPCRGTVLRRSRGGMSWEEEQPLKRCRSSWQSLRGQWARVQQLRDGWALACRAIKGTILSWQHCLLQLPQEIIIICFIGLLHGCVVRALCRGKLPCIKSSLKTWGLSGLHLVCTAQSVGTPSRSSISGLWMHLQGGVCPVPGARKPLWQLQHSARGLVRDFPHTRERRVDCVGFTVVWSWWSSIKIREHREGLRPMDCSSLPSSRDNLEPIKGIKFEESL